MRTALIGGASKGLGLGCARALASQGCRVILCARTKHEVEARAHELQEATGNESIGISCDWSKQDDIEKLREQLRKRDLQVDVLINNVGGPAPGLVTDLTEADWDNGLDLLFRSTLRLYGVVLPGMRERKWGRIVNILSTTAIEPAPMLAVSSVLRAALASYAKVVAWEVARDGVTVNSLMPGGFLTARTEQLIGESARRQNATVDTVRQQIESGLPIHRLMDPVELGHLTAFLASEQASGITGALIAIDGGTQKSV